MKKLCLFAIAIAISLVACDKSDVANNPNIRKAPKGYNEQIAKEYNTDFDRVAFAVNRLWGDANFREIIHKEASECSDCKFNVLISTLVEKYKPMIDLFQKYDVDIINIVEKYPLIQISIPEKWNSKETLPVVYLPYMFKEIGEEYLLGYDAEGKEQKFTEKELYEKPFVIVCEKVEEIYVDNVNVEVARAVAEGFFTGIEGNPSTVETWLIDSIVDWDGKTAIYVFNFAKESKDGFVLTSADIRNEPIIGYSNEGTFYANDEGMPEALMFMLAETMIVNRWLQDYGEKEKEAQKIIGNNAGSWANDLANFKKETNFKLNPEVVPYIDPCPNEPRTLISSVIDGEFNHFCKTNWNQEEPYNYYVPNHWPAGCVAVAMAQIMRFHKYPNVYNTPIPWESLPNYTTNLYSAMTTGDTYIAALLKHIGSNVDMEYGANGSSSGIVKAREAFVKKYDYSSCAEVADFDYNRIRTELKNKKHPIYARGDGTREITFHWKWLTFSEYSNGHAYVIDGVTNQVNTFEYTCRGEVKTAKTYRELMHYNFGWRPGIFGNTYNGWYSSSIRDEAGTYIDLDIIMGRQFPNFKYNKYCIYNIKPK